LLFAGEGKLDNKLEPSHKGLINVRSQISGENGYPLVFLHLLKEVAHLDVGVAIVGVFDLTPAAK
jgi:hypothetical protein